ncbi:pyridoxal-phosphate dependent enzyme [Nonomuraea thailandensis]
MPQPGPHPVHRARPRAHRRRARPPGPRPLRAPPRLPAHARPRRPRPRRGGVAYVKDESGRMRLGSFKALGGAYAVHLLAEREGGGAPFVCASAGNHGISVAAGAAEVGVPCVVHLSEGVPEAFAQRLRALGAEVRRAGHDYEASMTAAMADAQEHGWRLVADTSWDGYTGVPLDVMRGYSVLFDELSDPGAFPPAEEPTEADSGHQATGPTHVFVQAGVGGLAAAAAGYVRDRWGERPRIVVVEPDGAPCLLESARAGGPVRVSGHPTTLGRLDCREPSLLAHRLLSHLADLYLTISDEQAAAATSLLAAHGVRLSDCGAAGAAGLLALTPGARERLGLDHTARVLLVGTEGPVEPK